MSEHTAETDAPQVILCNQSEATGGETVTNLFPERHIVVSYTPGTDNLRAMPADGEHHDADAEALRQAANLIDPHHTARSGAAVSDHAAETDALIAKMREAISDEWMRPEHHPMCSGDPIACSHTCPVPLYQDAGFDQLLDAAALAAARVNALDLEPLTDWLENVLVEYDEDAQLFGSSGAGAYFLAKHIARALAARVIPPEVDPP